MTHLPPSDPRAHTAVEIKTDPFESQEVSAEPLGEEAAGVRAQCFGAGGGVLAGSSLCVWSSPKKVKEMEGKINDISKHTGTQGNAPEWKSQGHFGGGPCAQEGCAWRVCEGYS